MPVNVAVLLVCLIRVVLKQSSALVYFLRKMAKM